MAKKYQGTFPKMPTPQIVECTRSVNGMRKHGLLKGSYILRFKSSINRYRIVRFALATVANKKITYSNYPKFKDRVKAFGYNLTKVRSIRTTANCSNFVDGAVGAVTGKYVRDLGAKHNKKYLKKTKLFGEKPYRSTTLLAGDICGTRQHTWVITQGEVLSIGSQGTQVRRLQHYLNWFGNYHLQTDGDFGIKTLKAVKDFQKKVGLRGKGVFGKKSLRRAKKVKK